MRVCVCVCCIFQHFRRQRVCAHIMRCCQFNIMYWRVEGDKDKRARYKIHGERFRLILSMADQTACFSFACFFLFSVVCWMLAASCALAAFGYCCSAARWCRLCNRSIGLGLQQQYQHPVIIYYHYHSPYAAIYHHSKQNAIPTATIVGNASPFHGTKVKNIICVLCIDETKWLYCVMVSKTEQIAFRHE